MNRLPDLSGKTVLIVGGAQCDLSAVSADYMIAASGGIKYAPNADMLVTIDNKMPPYAIGADIGFAGLRVVGVPSDDSAHVYVPFPYETVILGENRTVHIRNNGISAIRLAVEQGAKHVVLIGFNAQAFDAREAHLGYDAGILATALPALIAELTGCGVVVEFHTPPVMKRSKTWPMST